MSWTLGMPSLKLNNVGGKSKHCGSFSNVAAEALEERIGRDGDIDVTKADENVYYGFRSAEELEEYSRRHVAELSEKQVAAGGRKIRNDAVVMCASIIKPPAAMMNELDRKDQIRFFEDSKEKFAEIVGEENIKSAAIHFDELGSHMHVFWEPMTPDGRLCAKELHNLQFFGELNREMPEHLRSRGWDIADCKAYDKAQEELKTEKEKNEERSKTGRSSARYKADAEIEKQKILRELDVLNIEAEKQKNLIQKKKLELEELEKAKGPFGRVGPLKAKVEALEAERSELIRTAGEMQRVFDGQITVLEREVERQKNLQPSIDEIIKNAENEKAVVVLEKENSRLRELIKKIFEFLKEHFPEVFKALNEFLEKNFSYSIENEVSKRIESVFNDGNR